MWYDQNKRVAFVCLGCKLNFAETSTWARTFTGHGYVRVSEHETADLYVVNTCSVTEQADKKCRQIIRHLHKIAPNARMVVTGCYAQLQAKELYDMEGVDMVIGSTQKADLFRRSDALMEQGVGGCYLTPVDQTTSFFPAYSSGDRTRSFLKVQDGCDYRCTYCTVPLARGPSRNLPIDQLVAQARILEFGGVKEVVLTGVNTGDYGKSTGESFLELLKKLSSVEGIKRWRISSIEPNLLTPEVLVWIAATPSFLPHFHLPLQSGSNKILTLMQRRYNKELFAERVAQIRTLMPFAFIGIDVMVGFPGENEEDFVQTYNFLESLAPSFLHIFPYSRRPHTPAASFPYQVAQGKKKERVRRLTQLSEQLYASFYEQNRGRTEEVLLEAKEQGGMMSGFTRNYLRMVRPFQKELIGEIAQMQIP